MCTWTNYVLLISSVTHRGTLGKNVQYEGQAKRGEVEGQAKLHDEHHDQSQARECDQALRSCKWGSDGISFHVRSLGGCGVGLAVGRGVLLRQGESQRITSQKCSGTCITRELAGNTDSISTLNMVLLIFREQGRERAREIETSMREEHHRLAASYTPAPGD